MIIEVPHSNISTPNQDTNLGNDLKSLNENLFSSNKVCTSLF